MNLWCDKLVVTTVDFQEGVNVGVSVYALNWNQMINADSNVRVFLLTVSFANHANRIGKGLLAADVDGGYFQPDEFAPIPLFGISDDEYQGVEFDAISILELSVDWSDEKASLAFMELLPTSAFDSTLPCTGADQRDCIPQKDTTQKIDFFSNRATRRLMNHVAYHRFDSLESMVMNSGVEAYAGVAGVW
jgi:hypothetical protein